MKKKTLNKTTIRLSDKYSKLDQNVFQNIASLENRIRKLFAILLAFSRSESVNDETLYIVSDIAQKYIGNIIVEPESLIDVILPCAIAIVFSDNFTDEEKALYKKIKACGKSTQAVIDIVKAYAAKNGLNILDIEALYQHTLTDTSSVVVNTEKSVHEPEPARPAEPTPTPEPIIQTESDPTVEEVITEPEPVKPAPMVSPEDARDLFTAKIEAMKNEFNGTPAMVVQEKSYIENRNIPKPEAAAIPPVRKINPQIQELEAELLRQKRLKHGENEFKDRYGKFSTLWEKYKKHHKFRKDPEVEEACRNAYNAFTRFFNTEDHQERDAQLKTVEDAIIVLRASEDN